MFCVLGALDHELTRHLVRRENPSAESAQLQTRDHSLPVAAQRCPPRQRGQRAEPKSGGSKSVRGQLAEHTPNLGTDSTLGYIPAYGRAGP